MHTFLLFVDDLWHQVEAVIGAVLSIALLVWEHKKGEGIRWRYFFAILMICLFIAFYRSWVDEHNVALMLIGEKEELASTNNSLRQSLATSIADAAEQTRTSQNLLNAQQGLISSLEGRRGIELPKGFGSPDPNTAKLVDELAQVNLTEPKQVKEDAISLANEITAFLSQEEQYRATNYTKYSQDLLLKGRQEFEPKAISIIERAGALKTRYPMKPGDLEYAFGNCSWGYNEGTEQMCADRLISIAENLPPFARKNGKP